MDVTLVPLTTDRLSDFATVLGDPAFGGCFCAVWGHFGEDWTARCGRADRPNLKATVEDVEQGRKAGYLLEVAGEVVGWLGAGPRTEFPDMSRRLAARRGRADAWVVGCVAVLPAARGKNVAEHAVRALVDLALTNGASVVEAFPVRPWDQHRAYRGSERMYERLGFTEVLTESDDVSEILLMRKML